MSRENQMRKNAETRQAIIDTAIAIGLEQGFEELSIRKITERLGYSSGIVYHYFKDKQGILDAIRTENSMKLKQRVEACIRSDCDFARNIKSVFKLLTEISIHSPEIFKLILLDKYSHKSETTAVWLDMIAHCIEMAVKNQELRSIDSHLAAHIILNSFLVAEMTIKSQSSDESKIEEIFDTELDIILHGILN